MVTKTQSDGFLCVYIAKLVISCEWCKCQYCEDLAVTIILYLQASL